MNISFLTSGHGPYDDRIFYHMARSLSDNNYFVEIVSSKCDLVEVADGIKINCFSGDNLTRRSKIKHFIDRLSVFMPEIIICSEPLTVLAAKYYSKKQNRKIRIIYDISEWYPSKKNLSVFKYPFRWLVFLKLLFFNLLVTRHTDSFIFGEWYKSRSYRILYPGKPFIFLSYFPNLKYFNYTTHLLQKGKLKLFYSGKISREKGYISFFKVLNEIALLDRNLKIEINIIGWYETLRDKKECEKLFYSDNPNISLKIFERQNFMSFIELLNETDIFLDLRSDDFENQHCLPIKLFYYAASGRPVIISDLKAIRKEVEMDKFGFLVKPNDYVSIARIVLDYLNDEGLYNKHCINARRLAENKYNWNLIESNFVKFISL